MRDAPTLLRSLVAAAEATITRPMGNVRELEALHTELTEAKPHCADPAGGLLIDDESMLLSQVLRACERQRHFNDQERARLFQQLAGVLLPAVRRALWHAIEVNREMRPTP